MTLLDFPMDARLGRIEERLGNVEGRLVGIERDIAVIKTRLDALAASLPTRWMQIVFLLAILVPVYAIMVTLLWNTIHH